MIFASMFIFILTLNEVAGPDFGTSFNIISFIVSCVMLAFLTLMIVVPFIITTMFVQRWGFRKGMYDDPQTFCEKVCSSYWNGVKKKFLSMNYYSFALSKNLIVAIAFVFIKDGTWQIVLLVAVSAGMFFYVIFIRPFESVLRNLLAVVNEASMFLSMLIMIRFVNDDDSNKSTVGYVIMGITGLCLAFVLILGNISMILAVYSLCKTKSRVRRAKSNRKKDGDVEGLQKNGAYNDQCAMAPNAYARSHKYKAEESKSESDIYMKNFQNKKQESAAKSAAPRSFIPSKVADPIAQPTTNHNKKQGIVMLPVVATRLRSEKPEKELESGDALKDEEKFTMGKLGRQLLGALPFVNRPSKGTQASNQDKQSKDTEDSKENVHNNAHLPEGSRKEPVQNPYDKSGRNSMPGDVSGEQEEASREPGTPSSLTERQHRSSVSSMLHSEASEESKNDVSEGLKDASKSINGRSAKSSRPEPVQAQNQAYFDMANRNFDTDEY
jgi:hypothetical protein